MISPGELWQRINRDFRRGWEASRHDYKTLPRIGEWAWPFWKEAPQTTPIHMIAGQDDWLLAAWTLASWFHFSEFAWPVVIHDDGTLPEEGRATLEKLFPVARIISRYEANAAVSSVLHAFPFCADYRRMHPLALKLFDVPHFAAADHFIFFDSRLLFFNHPREILDWAVAKADDCWFAEDAQERSLITAAEARSELGVKIWPRVNSGLCLLYKPAIDLDLCDRALAQTSIPNGQPSRIEQTLFMLCAAHHGKGRLLPRRYEVSLEKNAAEDAVARLYIGSASERFYGKGLKRLGPLLLSAGE